MDDGMLPLLFLYFWFAFSFAIAILADRYKRISAAWFFGSLLFTPLVAAAWLLAFGPKKPKTTK